MANLQVLSDTETACLEKKSKKPNESKKEKIPHYRYYYMSNNNL